MTGPAHTHLEGPGPAPLAAPRRAVRLPPAPPAPAGGGAAVAGLAARIVKSARRQARRTTRSSSRSTRRSRSRSARRRRQLAAGGINDAELRTLRDAALGDETIERQRADVPGRAARRGQRAHARGRDDGHGHDARPSPARRSSRTWRTPATSIRRSRTRPSPRSTPRRTRRRQTTGRAAWSTRTRVRAIFAQVGALTGARVAGEGARRVRLRDRRRSRSTTCSRRCSPPRPTTRRATARWPPSCYVGGRRGRAPDGADAAHRQDPGRPGGVDARRRARRLPRDGRRRRHARATRCYVPAALDINDVAHRSVVIHELTHAAQDAGVTGAKVAGPRPRAVRDGGLPRRRPLPAAGAGRDEHVRPPGRRPQIGALLNEISLMALMLESRADPPGVRAVVLQVEPVLARACRRPTSERAAAGRATSRSSAAHVRRRSGARTARATSATGDRIPGGERRSRPTALRGESILDWIDRT